MLDYLIALLDDSNDFHSKQQKPVTLFYYVEWSKVRLLAGLKQKKSI